MYDFAETLADMPQEQPRRHILKRLDEAIRLSQTTKVIGLLRGRLFPRRPTWSQWKSLGPTDASKSWSSFPEVEARIRSRNRVLASPRSNKCELRVALLNWDSY